MNRVKEYMQFAVWFVGLGYMALWPLTAHDNGIATLGAALICGSHSLGPDDTRSAIRRMRCGCRRACISSE